ncbi:MAG TPA: hypothetical protein VFW30_00870, partial [Bryocella sp.]|nr:hypothetical protein [Bryocella sp.]
MDRRQFIQAGVATGVIATTPCLASTKQPAKRPNVLYVFDDEHRFHSMPGQPYSDPVNAPNLDAFRKTNFSMEQC